jgi:ABC-2 type transport system ATP-binding protein
MSSPVLRMRNVTRRFGDVVALDSFNLAVSPRECVALIGHNGSGKTTTVRLASGFLEPSSGSVEVAGTSIHDSNGTPQVRSKLAFVTDNPVLYDDLTVREHLELVALAHGVNGDLDAEVLGVLRALGLERQGEFLPAELSRGMRQKTQIACALIRPFQILVLDEPVVGLDPPSQRALKDVLVERKNMGSGVLLTTHQLHFAEGLADRGVILYEGRVAAEGPFAEVIAGEVASELGLT